MGERNLNKQCTVSVSNICTQILRHKDVVGITLQQIKSLMVSTNIFPYPEIIEAVKQTKYYQEFGEITQNTLASIPNNERKPLHELFAAYYHANI